MSEGESTALTSNELAARRSRLSPAKQALLAKWTGGGGVSASAREEIPRLSCHDEPVLSFAQQRLWFLDQLQPGLTAYNVPLSLRLTGHLDVAALERSLGEIVQRHETLRTTIASVNGEPVPVTAPPGALPLSLVDLRDLRKEDREAEVTRLADREVGLPFDLARGPLIRARLLRLTPEEHVLLLTTHHIAFDGWSAGVLYRELGSLYEAYSAGRSSPLPELGIRYVDFAAWQRQWLSGETLSQQLSYWERKLANAPTLQLPTDRPRPNVQTFEAARLSTRLPRRLGAALEELSRAENVTLSSTLLAAFKVLLMRYTGQEDIVVGLPVANRNRQQIEPLIGFFVNSLVLRSDASGDPSFSEFLRTMHAQALDAYEHQDLPFEKLVEELNPERDLSRNPLFQVAFASQNAPLKPLKLEGLTVSVIEKSVSRTRVDLELHLWDLTEGLLARFAYNTDLFDSSTIERMSGHYVSLLEGIVANPGSRLSSLPLLSEEERQEVLFGWNRTEASYAQDACVHELFEAQASSSPSTRAVVCGEQELSYGELNERANRLAHHLRSRGVGPETLVGLCVDRSPELVVGLLAILKAGGAYVPLDPTYPRDRLSFMLSDCRAPVLLTQTHLLPELPGHGAEVVCVDREESWASLPSSNPPCVTCPENLAYVIYTSGSTGKPKAALLSHRGLCSLSAEQGRSFGVGPGSRVLQFSSLSFDASTFEVVMALPKGGTLILGDRMALMPGPELLEFLARHRVSIVTLPPSALGALPVGDLSDLATITVAGEACGAELVSRWAPGRRFFNLYGPTEATIWSTMAELFADGSVPHIGRPIGNTKVHILDVHGEPVPIGAPGELCIGGVGLARGYLGRAELTAERFVPDPYAHGAGGRLYRSGDLARYRPDGRMEFLGRVDHQVKVRGFRIELGEIEVALASHAQVQEAVVMAHEGQSGERDLVAYVCPQPETSDRERGEHVEQWRSLYEETYGREAAEDTDPTFNITGWNSSYTGEPIPAEQMREWVDRTVEGILSRNPQRVLELGCGSGLLLFRVAPHCRRYVGMDFSQQAVDYVSRHLNGALNLGSKVQVHRREAEDLEGVEPGSFDTVILNSVVQYFPGIDYLLRVLEGAVEVTAAGGVVFVGDVRSLPLLEAYHASVQLHQAGDDLSSSRLHRRVQERVAQEEELAIDPAFFVALGERLERVSHVEIRPKRGRSSNELTKFRYEVVLHVEGAEAELPEVSWQEWSSSGLTMSGLREQLSVSRPAVVGLRGIPNARTAADARVLERLSSGVEETAEELRSSVKGAGGLDPEAVWSLGEELPYRVELSWLRGEPDGRYDALLVRHDADQGQSMPVPRLRVQPWSKYANSPLQAKMTRQLAPKLREHLSLHLPEYMIPSAFVMLETLPLTPNGKVDRKALPEPHLYSSQSRSRYVPPRTPLEAQLVEIWSEVLGVERIGVEDDFFELGGHSLLATQIASRLRRTVHVELPLQSLFESPTIAGLAEEIETLRWAAQVPAATGLPLEEMEKGSL